MAFFNSQRIEEILEPCRLGSNAMIGFIAAIIFAKTGKIGKDQPIIFGGIGCIKSPIVLIPAETVDEHQWLARRIATFEIGPGHAADHHRFLHQPGLASQGITGEIEQHAWRKQIKHERTGKHQRDDDEQKCHGLAAFGKCASIQPVTSARTASRSGSLKIS